MKTWLTKLRISHALDERRALPPDVARAVAASPELRRFAASAGAVDCVFKNARPAVAAPPTLHASIMRAVRDADSDAGHSSLVTHHPFWPRWMPAAALAALILFTVFGTHFSPAPPANSPPASPLAVADSALETGGNWIQNVPAALSPLAEEMASLNRDLTNAQNYLLASLP